MKIHECAAMGDVAGVVQAIAAGVPIDSYNVDGITPLMVAAESEQATPETLRELIRLGANVNALTQPTERDREFAERHQKPVKVNSVLGYAVKHASFDKISVLLDAGANVRYVDARGYSVLLHFLFRFYPDTSQPGRQLVSRLIAAGAPLDVASSYGELPVTVTSRRGQFELLQMLLDAGADPWPLGWNALFFAVACGRLDEVERFMTDPELLSARDCWDRTPFLVAIQTGTVDKAAALLSAGADLYANGRCEHSPLMYALEGQHAGMVKWLIEQGVDINEANEMGEVPLTRACQMGSAECVRTLLAAGADATRRSQLGRSLMNNATTLEIVELLSESKLSWDDIGGEMRQTLAGHEESSLIDASLTKYAQYRNRQFGRSNPERMNNPFWEAMVRSRVSGYHGAMALGEISTDREATWCFTRYGHSFTKLSDGRYVEIGGEHEDHYDPDFCIYNDVVVHHGDGTFDIYGYPEETFPPTDFHSATLVGANIYIIGSLGYARQREPGRTPVYQLDTNSFSIKRVDCMGSMPGWIHGHSARVCDGHEIEVAGGEVLQENDLVPNTRVFRLNIARGAWRCLTDPV